MPDWDEVRIRTLEAQVHSLREHNKVLDSMLDTYVTPPWKRLWFFIKGYRLYKLGTWYNAPWNENGQRYN